MNQAPVPRQLLGQALLIGALALAVLVIGGASAWAFLVPTDDHRNLRYLLWKSGRLAFQPAFDQAFARDPDRARLVLGADLATLGRLFPSISPPLDPEAIASLGLPAPVATNEVRWLGRRWLIESRAGRVIRFQVPTIFHC